MAQDPMQAASIPNPRLKPFDVLIGTWKTTGSHPMIPDTILHGRVTFEWLENGAFVLMRSEGDTAGVPGALSIFGSDDSTQEFFMLYFDERGVSRKYDVTLSQTVWKIWRNAPGFSQRFTGSIGAGGSSINGKWEFSEDGSTWKKDLELDYKRVE